MSFPGLSFYTDEFMWNVLGIDALPIRASQFTCVDALEKILEADSLPMGWRR